MSDVFNSVDTQGGTARRLTIVVPAFNEERHIAATLDAVLDAACRTLDAFEIIVVDDGSSDGTGRIADEAARGDARIQVVHQPQNRGVGAAYLIGLAAAQYEAITVVPGDNAFSRTTLNDVFAAVGSAPMIVSYRANMEVRTPIRRVLSVACTWSMRMISGRWIRDAHSMFVFPVALARQFQVQPGYGYHIESLGRLLLMAPTYREIPAILNPRPDANSGVMRFRVVFLLVATMLRLALWRIQMALFFVSDEGEPPRIAALGRIALIGCAVLALVLAFAFGKILGLDKSDPSGRTSIHAIPVAISQIYHGRRHDYTADYSIAITFQTNRPLSELISAAVHASVPPNDRTYFWTADDRGLSDFVNLSFRLFGPRITSLYYFWFLMLAGSLAAALICFRRDPPALASIASGVIAIGAILPAFIRAPATHLTLHISESRTFELLAAIAVIHVVLSVLRPRMVGAWTWCGTLAIQTFVLTFLMHTRSSLAWLFVTLITIAVAAVIFRWRSANLRAATLSRSAIPAAMLMAGWMTMATYQMLMFHPAYRGEIGPRTVWHNVLMGLSFNQTMATELKIPNVGDYPAAEAVLRYARARNDTRFSDSVTAQDAMNSLGSYNSFNWRGYEQVARDLVWHTLAEHPADALRLIAWDKPKAIAKNIVCDTMLLQSVCGYKDVYRPRVRVDPLFWPFAGLLLIMIGSYYFATPRREANDAADVALRPLLVATLWIAFVGLLPSIVFYPAFTQLAGTMVFGIAALYLAITMLLIRLIRYVIASRVHATASQAADG